MLNLFYVSYFLGFFMILFTGYLIYTYSKAFNDVKVKTRNYLRFMRKIEKGVIYGLNCNYSSDISRI